MLQRLKRLLSRYGIGPGRRLTAEGATLSGVGFSRLHLGCGHVHIPGWTNCDVLRTGATDVVIDICTLPGIPPGSVDVIYACHVLEHFATSEVPAILRRWCQVLRGGGEVRLSVPDLDAITRIYQEHLDHFQVPGNQPWIALIYGGQKDQYDFHKTGFNFAWMKGLLEQAGFTDVRRYDAEPHFIPGIRDNSSASAPFGKYISLNVRATAPG
jgi:predicted SAM-dependent methyltransferase